MYYCLHFQYRRTVTYMRRVYGHNRPDIIPLAGSNNAEERFAIYNRRQTSGLFDVAILEDRV